MRWTKLKLMSNNGSSKKITRVDKGVSSDTRSSSSQFQITPESKSKATKYRLFAALSWFVAIACEVYAIYLLTKVPVQMTWLIVFIALDLIFVVIGSLLWKKANRLNPASEKNGFKFFVQNQLGLIIAVIAFLPIVIMVFTNKNLTGKQKGIVGAIAVVALIVASLFGIDFNPPSIEQYAEQTEQVKSLNNGVDYVYWTKSGKSYHLYSSCSYINSNKTNEIFEGTVAQARELKNITDLCNRCESRAVKDNEKME